MTNGDHEQRLRELEIEEAELRGARAERRRLWKSALAAGGAVGWVLHWLIGWLKLPWGK